MHATTVAVPAQPRTLAPILHARRARNTLIASILWALLLSASSHTPLSTMIPRTVVLAFFAMLIFGIFERWPKRLPRWLARWVLQVLAVASAIPPSAAALFALTNPSGAPAFFEVPGRFNEFSQLAMSGVLFAPWAALASIVRQREGWVREQALAFQLERSELERQALDARLRLLQAQVAPHFLFNTLANVQALVDTGSPQASDVLRSLIAYLRAAVPRLNEPATTLGEELQLVQAYLELMHMRMPDRLQFTLHVEDSARMLRCPPMTLLTLVENAVRHGIDPSEEGGRIDIHVQRRGDRCVLRVSDTGAGFGHEAGGLGTGLATLHERLELAFHGDAELRVSAQHPRGVSAEVDFPAREGTPGA